MFVPRKSKSQLLLQLAVPLVFILLGIGAEYTGLDLWIAQLFYDPIAHEWPYRALFITDGLLHTGGRNLMVLLALVNFALLIASCFSRRLAPYRKHLLFILVAALAGPLAVKILKSTTHIYVPWHLMNFGGDKPYIRLFDHVPAGSPPGNAFPGAHSSSGFAYMSIYFLLSRLGSKYRYYGLAVPVSIGILFSITQEIRGAHFLSHDIFSFAICWTAALLLSLLFYGLDLTNKNQKESTQWIKPKKKNYLAKLTKHMEV